MVFCWAEVIFVLFCLKHIIRIEGVLLCSQIHAEQTIPGCVGPIGSAGCLFLGGLALTNPWDTSVSLGSWPLADGFPLQEEDSWWDGLMCRDAASHSQPPSSSSLFLLPVLEWEEDVIVTKAESPASELLGGWLLRTYCGQEWGL